MTRESDQSPTSSLPYDRLAVELLRRIRGTRSQAWFSRRLGYDSNVVYTWETGRRSPTASRFFAAVEAVGIDVEAATATFLRRATVAPLDEPAGVAAFVAAAVGDQPIAAVAARAGCSRHQIARWRAGTAEPRLPDLLRAIEGATMGLLDWLAGWIDPDELASVRATWRSMRGARALARASPWTGAVMLALGLADYQALGEHAPGWIAARLGLPPDVEQGSIDLLVAAGLVLKEGGRLIPSPRPALDLRGSPPRTDLKAFWSRVAVERLEAGEPGLHTWNLFSASAEAYARIEALQRRFYADMRAEVAASEGRELVAVAVLHLVRLG